MLFLSSGLLRKACTPASSCRKPSALFYLFTFCDESRNLSSCLPWWSRRLGSVMGAGFCAILFWVEQTWEFWETLYEVILWCHLVANKVFRAWKVACLFSSWRESLWWTAINHPVSKCTPCLSVSKEAFQRYCKCAISHWIKTRILGMQGSQIEGEAEDSTLCHLFSKALRSKMKYINHQIDWLKPKTFLQFWVKYSFFFS